MDCWIPTTTKMVFGKEMEGLQGQAGFQGLGFVALDWSPVEGLPRLPKFSFDSGTAIGTKSDKRQK